MSAEDESRAGLVPSPSAALTYGGAASLVRRGAQDLYTRAQADALFNEGTELWEQEEYERALTCFTQGLSLCPLHAELLYWMGKACDCEVGKRLGLNEVDAEAWYLRSAELGLTEAHSELAWWYYSSKHEDLEQSRRWFRSAAERGDTEDQFWYACFLSEGQLGVPCDFKEALRWFLKAAESGHPNSQCALGCAFKEGWVEKDFAQAAFWHRKAAEQDLVPAQVELGDAYAAGSGVPLDYSEAVKWWRKAAEHDYDCEPSKQGDEDAQYRLGRAYDLGQGVPQDYVQAAYWYRRATVQGHEEAQRAFNNTYKKVALESGSNVTYLNLDNIMKLDRMLRKAGLDGLEEFSGLRSVYDDPDSSN